MSGLFLTADELTLTAPGWSTSVLRQGELSEDLAAFLPDAVGQLPPDQLKCDLVLDRGLYHFKSLSLPPVPARKLPQILPFELDNHFLCPPESLILPFSHRLERAQGRNLVAVYGLESQWLEALREQTEAAGLELRRVLALENLMALEQQTEHPGLWVQVRLEERQARLLWFQSGFPWAYGLIPRPEGEGTALYSDWARQINAQLAAAGLSEGPFEMSLDNAAQLVFEVEDFQLKLRQPFEPKPLPSAARPELLNAQLLKRKGLVPLQQERGALIKELTKYKAQLKRTGLLAAGLALLWASWLGLGLWQGQAQVARLEAAKAQALRQYAPGLSPSNGLEVLEDRVASLKTTQGGGGPEPYGYSKRLAQLASLRKLAPSFTLKRAAAQGDDWTLSGQTESAQDFEAAKAELARLFPPEKYGMTLSQQAKGDAQVSFSVSLVLKEGR